MQGFAAPASRPAKKAARKYDEGSITGYTRDLDKIRAKPTLYIGPTDDDGVFTLLRECMDNAVDEARAGRNDLVDVIVEGPQGPFTVADNGVGIPVKVHPKMKISTLTHVLTNLQSSGKIQGDAYESAIGTHGVGQKGVVALSASFDCWTFRSDSGGWHHTSFKESKETSPVKKCGSPGGRKRGTVVKFMPSPIFFKKSKLDLKRLVQWAELTSYMNPGLTIRVKAAGKTKEWKSENGVKDYLAARLKELKAKPINQNFLTASTPTMEFILTWADVEGSQVQFFTNTVRNVEEGVHATDMYRALHASLKPFDPPRNKVVWGVKDLQDGMVGLLNYKINAPQFDSQTKEKLVDARVKGACYKECLELFSAFWKKHPGFAKELVTRAIELRSRTNEFLTDKKLIKNVQAAKKTLSGKLAAIQGNAPIEARELFIVEGDSAGGGVRRIRDRRTQAVLPLKGKPLNPIDTPQAKINSNTEIVSLLAALGVDLNSKSSEPKINYGKVILMADADVDGQHINTLLQAILWKYVPHLFAKGCIYSVRSPLFKANHKGKTVFGMTKEEIYKQLGTKNVDCTYLKGWGELNDEDLVVAIQPGIRTLIKIDPPNREQAAKFLQLMGSCPSYRKQMLGIELAKDE